MTKRKPKSEWEPRSPFAMTDAEIAERLGISRQRVDQIEREAMRKVRRMMKERFSGSDFFDDLEGA